MLIPLPFLTALVSAIFLARLVLLRALPMQSRVLFGVMFALAAVGSTLIGMRFGYGMAAIIPFQRPIPLMLGPALFLGFAAMQAPVSAVRIAAHFGIAVALAIATSIYVGPLDLIIALSYATYWVLLFLQYRRGGEGMAALPMEVTEQMRRWMLGALVFFAAVIVLENAVTLSFVFGAEQYVVPLISFGSLPLIALLLFGALNLPQGKTKSAGPVDSDALEQIDAYLAETKLYRDPELSLTRLARRLGQPVKSLSRTINAATGASVSHYINNWRIDEAAELLRSSPRKVDDIAQACGFLSRSNFYREFQRVHKESPSAFRKANGR